MHSHLNVKVQKCMYFKHCRYINIHVHIALFFLIRSLYSMGLPNILSSLMWTPALDKGSLYILSFTHFTNSLYQNFNFKIHTWHTVFVGSKLTNFMLIDPTNYMPLLLKPTIQHNCDVCPLHHMGTICRILLIWYNGSRQWYSIIRGTFFCCTVHCLDYIGVWN